MRRENLDITDTSRESYAERGNAMMICPPEWSEPRIELHILNKVIAFVAVEVRTYTGKYSRIAARCETCGNILNPELSSLRSHHFYHDAKDRNLKNVFCVSGYKPQIGEIVSHAI